jgi:hypothetical protein
MPTSPTTGAIAIMLVAGGWLYFSGRLDPLIEAYQRAGLPADEVAFVATVQQAKQRWTDAPNDIQREGMVTARNNALCGMPANVSDWTGRIKRVGTYLALDKVALAVTLTPSITLRTEGDLQDAGTKVARGTPLFDSVATLAEGQQVRFSGNFLQGDKTCRVETSLTNNGSMTDPAFEFAFTKVEANR